MTSNDGHASSAGLEVCLWCKKGVKGNEAGLECDLCHYWFHTKCEGVGADLYKALQKFEEAVRVGRSNSAIKWYCDSCARTVEKVNGRLLQLEMGQMRLMDEMEKLKEKMNQEMKELKEELEDKLSGHKDKVRVEGEEPAGSSSKLLPIPLKQEITEALDIEKRKDMVVIRGIQESEDMDEKVGRIMKELGFSKQYTVIGRIGGLRKRGAEESDIADIGRNRLVSLKMESVAVKWRVVSESRKLSNSENFKDIFISPDLTRKQAEEDRKLRLKLKEIRMKGEVLDGVKISKGRIVGRVDGHVIYDPSA